MDDDGTQGNESVNDGIFDEIASANHELYASRGQLDKAANDPAVTGKTGGGTPTKQKTQKATTDQDEEEDEGGDNAEGLDTQDFSRETEPKEDTEDTDEAKDEPSQTETKTEAEDIDWKSGLPADPGEFQEKPPEPDENGQIDPLDYTDFLEKKILHRQRVEAYNDKVITATFDAVEKILPEVKTDPAFQQAIRSTFNSTLSGEETVTMARNLRQSIDKVAMANKATGAQNAKTSISIQKNAAVETQGATKKKSTSTKSDNLTKRLQKNDTSAFEELMGNWMEDGKI